MKKKRILVVAFAILTIIVMILAMTGTIDETIGMCVGLAMTVLFNLIVAVAAYKNDIKIITVLMGIFMVIGLVFLGMNIITLFQNGEPNTPTFKIKVTEDDSPKKSIFSHDGKNFYTYNIKDIEVTVDKDKTYQLKEALQGGHITFDEILSMTIPNEGTNGYKIYYDGGNGQSKDMYSIILCETSKDVIFAPYNYEYEESICSSVAD